MGVEDLRSRARHDHLRQGLVGGDPADLGIDGQREDLPGDAVFDPALQVPAIIERNLKGTR